MIESFRGQELDAHYLGYFDCFNRQLFYESHDVLEELCELLTEVAAEGQFLWNNQQLVHLFPKGRREPWATAIVSIARLNAGTNSLGSGMELYVIAAAVIGGSIASRPTRSTEVIWPAPPCSRPCC